jgi:GTP cyclohydrolase I
MSTVSAGLVSDYSSLLSFATLPCITTIIHTSHKAKSTLSRLNASPAEKAARQIRLTAAVRTVLECIGEDPDREGLLRTPERYAQALMWMTKGYEERLAGIVITPVPPSPPPFFFPCAHTPPPKID